MKSKKLKIYLKPEDFNKKKLGGQYENPNDCPLARAVRRQLSANWVIVVYDYLNIFNNARYSLSKRYSFSKEDWNFSIAQKVAECYAQGDTTQYYVEIEKV